MEPQWLMSGLNTIAPVRLTISQDRKAHRGYMVALYPTRLRLRHLTDSMSGHMWWWQREGLRDVEKRLLAEHGTVVRWNGALGVRFILGSPAMGRCDANTIV